MRPFTVAIMQPYFLPYAGYFRLFVASDLFVIYDCVQFPRRGWVHRNRLVDASGTERWLTLPLAKTPQSTLIRDLRFAPNAPATLAERFRRFPALAEARAPAGAVVEAVHDVGGTPLAYIERVLQRVVGYLGLPWNTLRSSALDLPASLHGQARVLEIARRLGARRYVNPPGGRHLYDEGAFSEAGIELRFLPVYQASTSSILTRIASEDRHDLAREMRRAAQ